MAFPNSGLLKIFPLNTTIPQGRFSFNNDPSPQTPASDAAVDAYFDARTPSVPTGPCATRDNLQGGVNVPFAGDHELFFSPSTIGIEFYDTTYPGPIAATLDTINVDFPSGMMINQAQLFVQGQISLGTGRNLSLTSVKLNYAGANFYTFTNVGPAIASSISSPTTGTGAIVPNFFSNISLLQFLRTFGVTFPFQAAVSGVAFSPDAIISQCFLLAAYNTQLLQFTNSSPNALTGTTVELVNSQSRLGNFDQDEFKIYWDARDDEVEDPDFPGFTGGVAVPRNLILEFTDTIFRFIMPPGIPWGGRRLMLTGTAKTSGTLFSGTYPLQNFNIELVDGSGLYTIVDDKRNDTYYDRSVTPPIEIDLKIPDPFVKTGFFNA